MQNNSNQRSETLHAGARELSDASLSTVTGGLSALPSPPLEFCPVVIDDPPIPSLPSRGDVCPIAPPDVFFDAKDFITRSQAKPQV